MSKCHTDPTISLEDICEKRCNIDTEMLSSFKLYHFDTILLRWQHCTVSALLLGLGSRLARHAARSVLPDVRRVMVLASVFTRQHASFLAISMFKVTYIKELHYL